MTTTVRLDEALGLKLEYLAKTLRKKKSDVIRDAIDLYVSSIESVESKKKSRILLAIEKTKEADKTVYNSFEVITH